MPNPDSKDSLQKKLSDKAFDIKRIDKLVFRSRGGWKEVGGVLFKNMVRLSDVEEAVRTIVSQIQDRIDKLVQDRNRVPLKTLSRILELEWAHFLITGETYKVLLVSSSTPTETEKPLKIMGFLPKKEGSTRGTGTMTKWAWTLNTQRNWEAKDKADLMDKIQIFFMELSEARRCDFESEVTIWEEKEGSVVDAQKELEK